MKHVGRLILVLLASVSVMISGHLAAQEQPSTLGHKNPHSCRLIELETFGGPTAYLYGSDRTSEVRILNEHGMVTGWTTFATLDPCPDFCCGDCFLAHTFQWRNGVMTDLGALVDGVNSDARWITNDGLNVDVLTRLVDITLPAPDRR